MTSWSVLLLSETNTRLAHRSIIIKLELSYNSYFRMNNKDLKQPKYWIISEGNEIHITLYNIINFKISLHKDANQLSLGRLLEAVFSSTIQQTPTISICLTSLATHCHRHFQAGEEESWNPQFIPCLTKDGKIKAQSRELSLQVTQILILCPSPIFPCHCYFHLSRLLFFCFGAHILINLELVIKIHCERDTRCKR